jgi:S-layer protein (TIGR01567 family)
MNKKIILPFVAILVLAVAMIGAASADDNEVTTVDTVEIRGTIMELDTTTSTIPGNQTWNYSTFAGFWYDLDDNLKTENLTILANTLSYPNDREIDEGHLVYTTKPVFQEYELHQDITVSRTKATAEENKYNATGLLEQHIGLLVESDNPQGDCGYYIEGWMAEEYIAIDGNADELCKLLVEFEDDDKKTLSTGEEWDLGGGFSLTANQIDLEGNKVWFSLAKDGRELDNEVATTGGDEQKCVYTYTADIGNEEDIPVFSCYVDAVFRGTDSNVVQVMYVFLIDDDVLEIDTSDTYGGMEVMTASKSRIKLTNDETTIELDEDTTEHIMGDMYFKTADDDNAIRFYPMVEYTIGEAPGEAEEEVETPTEVETPEANVTPTAEVTPTLEPTAAPEDDAAADADTAADAEETATEKKTPGFEAVFAIAGLLAVAYLVLRQRE